MIRITRYGPVIRFDLARTIAGRGRYWTTCYSVDGVLVDAGPAYCATELVQSVAELPLKTIFNTHTHEDHIGADGPLQRSRPGLEILAHPLALPVIANPAQEQPLHPYRRFFWGWPDPATAKPVNEGDQVQTEHFCFDLLYTPGHAIDHLCLYESRQGWLFSGDLYVGGRDRALRAGYDIWQIIASLKRLVDLPIRVLFPGSARIRENPAQVITDKIDYLESTGEQVLELNHQGYNIDKIARRLFGPPGWIEYITLGHFSRRNLVRSYLGINQDK